uniref:Family with sequence similarity 204 member A n=1 Tax=Laticauda laticaudata TaxID=8630 RepID=A0A8C5RD74_LATLA
MWSGLLPPGVNEADVAVSSDNEETVSLPESMLNEKQEEKKFLDKQTCDHEEKNMAENQLPSAEQECLACLPGVPLDMWNKFQNLKKKNLDMKNQEKCQRNKQQKRKHSQKGGLILPNFFFLFSFLCSQEYAKERHFKELTQYFGINDRFKPLESKETTQKSGLEISIDKCVAEGNIAQAEELSDRLATRELGVKIAKAVACRNFVKAKQDVEVIQEARKKKKLAWGFEAKKRWETKSNMGYM